MSKSKRVDADQKPRSLRTAEQFREAEAMRISMRRLFVVKPGSWRAAA